MALWQIHKERQLSSQSLDGVKDSLCCSRETGLPEKSTRYCQPACPSPWPPVVKAPIVPLTHPSSLSVASSAITLFLASHPNHCPYGRVISTINAYTGEGIMLPRRTAMYYGPISEAEGKLLVLRIGLCRYGYEVLENQHTQKQTPRHACGGVSGRG